MGVIVSLLDEGQLLTLRLVQTSLHRVSLLQLFKSEDKQLGIMLVR
jgi:hypothetical protein